MHVFGSGGLKRQVIHAAPAIVGLVVQPGFNGNRTGAHGRQHIQHGRFHVVLHVKFDGVRPCINCHCLVLATVFDHAGVLFSPDFFEQSRLGRDIRVGVQNQHF